MKLACAVTGASGYVGGSLAAALAADFEVVPMGRSVGAEGIRWSMNDSKDLAEQLRAREVKVLIHSAWDFTHSDRKQNWATNVEGSSRLFAEAKAAGVSRIIFISTISAFDGARSNYGQSKLAVEKLTVSLGGVAIRPGLVWGNRPGGMFGSLKQQVSKGGLVPMIGDGRYPQYLVHEDDLAEVVRRAAGGEFSGHVLTAAHAQAWMLRDLILAIAKKKGKRVSLIGLPWRIVYAALGVSELLNLNLAFRSDSLISLVYANPKPDFSHDVLLRAFDTK